VNCVRPGIRPEAAPRPTDTGKPDRFRTERHDADLSVEHVDSRFGKNGIERLPAEAPAVVIPHHRKNRQSGERQQLGRCFRLDQLPTIGDIAGDNQEIGNVIQSGQGFDQVGRDVPLDVQISNCGNANHSSPVCARHAHSRSLTQLHRRTAPGRWRSLQPDDAPATLSVYCPGISGNAWRFWAG
jgi:hypothetical protein